MYIPVWGMCLLSFLGGCLLTFLVEVMVVAINSHKKGE